MGWVGVAVGLAAIAALAVGMAVFTANTNKATEATLAQNEADMEAAEAANDLSEKWAEQQDSMDGLIKKYKDLKDAGEDY
jgi:Flp pilus assembly protein TadB